jgi:polysaccharide export outer membrane protein
MKMEKHVTIFFLLLALAAASQPLGAQASRPSPAPAPQTERPPAVPAPAAPAPAAPYQPEFVIPRQQDSGQTPAATVNPNSYRVGLNDEVKITVFDEPDLSTMYRVDADGSLSFPLIGRVQAAGTTLSELQQRITSMLANGFIKNPQVRVEVNQYKSQFVYVIGEVRAPGKITMTGTRMTLLEALALAGSPTANASNEVIVVHPTGSGPDIPRPGAESEGARVSVNRKDLELGKAGQDVVLLDGDIINVPSAQHFYITGMVRNPGTFVLDPGIDVQQAIALAGGLNDRGSNRRIKISRLVNGKLAEMGVELVDKIQAGDTVMISGRFF